MKKKMENFKSHFKITDNKDVIACGIPALDGDNHGRTLQTAADQLGITDFK